MTLKSRTIANILYNMALDMDYADYEDYFDNEITYLAEEIDGLSDALKCVLETIAIKNDDFYNLFT